MTSICVLKLSVYDDVLRIYRILPYIMRTHGFDPNFQGEKNLSF